MPLRMILGAPTPFQIALLGARIGEMNPHSRACRNDYMSSFLGEDHINSRRA